MLFGYQTLFMAFRSLILTCMVCCIFPLKSQQLPDPPELERVTVLNSGGHVGIEWSYNQTQNIEGYIIYWKDPTRYPDPGDPIDTVYNLAATTFIDISGRARNNQVFYSVAAFGTFGNEFRKSPQADPHATIYLETAFDSCQQQNVIAWKPYHGWDDPDIGYRIFSNGSEIGTTTDTFFVDDNIDYNTSYMYYVVAEETRGLRSASNRSEISTAFPAPPEYINADYVSVTSNNAFEVSFSMPSVDSDIQFILTRTNNASGITDTLRMYQGGTENITYIDNNIDILQDYNYQMTAVNPCNDVIAISNVASNIVLTGSRDNNAISLQWGPYETWLGDVAVYEIYRDNGNGFRKIAETQATSFIDNSDNFNTGTNDGTIYYYVHALEGIGNPHGLQAQSRSNTAMVVLKLNIEFPTAFTPNGDGQNDYFSPINLQFVPQQFNLVIYDRWGMPVFESVTVNDRWNGTNRSGKKVMEGVYNYQVEFTTQDGKNHRQTGYVTILYP